jgi:hypothetical protein
MNATILLAAVLGQFAIPDTPIARRIVAEWPELATAETDFERVNILRRFAWGATTFIDHRSNNEPSDSIFHAGHPQPPVQRVSRMTATEFYRQFDDNAHGVFMFECVLGLSKLYQEFGYVSGRVVVGSTNYAGSDLFYAQSIVQIQHAGKTIVVAQDPVFNATWIDVVTREPLDYFEMLSRLARREHESSPMTL